MPTIVMSKLGSSIKPEDRKKAMAFLLKLGENDTTAGLHIEPIPQQRRPPGPHRPGRPRAARRPVQDPW